MKKHRGYRIPKGKRKYAYGGEINIGAICGGLAVLLFVTVGVAGMFSGRIQEWQRERTFWQAIDQIDKGDYAKAYNMLGEVVDGAFNIVTKEYTLYNRENDFSNAPDFSKIRVNETISVRQQAEQNKFKNAQYQRNSRILFAQPNAGINGRTGSAKTVYLFSIGRSNMKKQLSAKQLEAQVKLTQIDNATRRIADSNVSDIQKVLNIAKMFVGYGDDPPLSNHNIFTTEYWGEDVFDTSDDDLRHGWCSIFVWYVFNKAGLWDALMAHCNFPNDTSNAEVDRIKGFHFDLSKVEYSGHCANVLAFWYNLEHDKGVIIHNSAEVRPGDIIHYEYTHEKYGKTGHTMIAELVNPKDNYLVCLTGNAGDFRKGQSGENSADGDETAAIGLRENKRKNNIVRRSLFEFSLDSEDCIQLHLFRPNYSNWTGWTDNDSRKSRERMERVQDIALSYVGFEDSSGGDNIFNREWYCQDEITDIADWDYGWCLTFLWYIFRKAKLERLLDVRDKSNFHKLDFLPIALNQNAFVSSGYKRGDLALLKMDGTPDNMFHVALIEQVWDYGIATIEASVNYTENPGTSYVKRIQRPLNMVYGAYRPKY